MRVATGITTANDAKPQTSSSWASESLAGNDETLQIRDCDVCCTTDVKDTYRSRQCVINTGGGSLNIDGMRTGRGGLQVVINRGGGGVHIRGMSALDDSMQFVCCSDDEKDMQAMLQHMMAHRPPPPPPQHLHTAELAITLSKIWCIAQEQETAPMFGGLCSETIAEGKHRWRCLFFQNSDRPLASSLTFAGLDLETWICAEMFASTLWHCTQCEGQITLCPNWLWARREDIFRRESGQPRATLERMQSLIAEAPMCVVRRGDWFESHLVEIWKLSRGMEEQERGVSNQDYITMIAVMHELCRWTTALSM